MNALSRASLSDNEIKDKYYDLGRVELLEQLAKKFRERAAYQAGQNQQNAAALTLEFQQELEKAAVEERREYKENFE